MTRESSHEFTSTHYVATAHNERAEALTRFGFLAIAGDRAVRRTLSVGSGVSSLVSGWNDFSGARDHQPVEARRPDAKISADPCGYRAAPPTCRCAGRKQQAALAGAATTATVHELKRAARVFQSRVLLASLLPFGRLVPS
jgi:hypothetical protein